MGASAAGDFAIRYARSGAGIARYALTRHDSVAATMPSGESQVQVFGSTAYVTLTWLASDTGARITAAVDSVVPDSGLSFVPAVLDSARGARWTGLRRPTGRLTDLTGGPSSLISDQVREQIQLIFPPASCRWRPTGRQLDRLHIGPRASQRLRSFGDGTGRLPSGGKPDQLRRAAHRGDPDPDGGGPRVTVRPANQHPRDR